jgi:hypothetical protein
MANKNGGSADRLERMEIILDRLVADHEQLVAHHQEFAREHKQLLTAQVVLTDRMEQFAKAQQHTDSKMAETAEKLNALIAVVDGIVRRQHPGDR